MLRTRPEWGKEAIEPAPSSAREGAVGYRVRRRAGAWAASWARSQRFTSSPAV
jgi:hypothetical protein